MPDSSHSLYDMTAETSSATSSNPFPPGTMRTASIETIDNDVACLMLNAGVVR